MVVDLTSDGEEDFSTRPPKRSRISNRNPGDDDMVVLVSEAAAGPSSSAAQALLPAGDDMAVVNDNTVNVNIHMAHSRENCATYKFCPLKSASNCLNCSKCFCGVCDEPASKCKRWTGYGNESHCHHSKAPTKAIGASTSTQNPFGPFGAYPHVHAESFTGYMDTDEAEYGMYDSDMEGCYMDEYDDIDPFAMMDGYHHPKYCCGDMPLYRQPPSVHLNPWTLENMDYSHYAFSSSAADVPVGTRNVNMERARPTCRPYPRKLVPITVSVNELKGMVKLGSIELPVVLKNGLDLGKASRSLALAPWDYEGEHPMKDWRSWTSAYWGGRLSLSSIILHQSIPSVMPPGLRTQLEDRLAPGVSMPEFCKQQIAIGRVTSPSDPQDPPSSDVIRVVNFIDCCGSLPLTLIGIACPSDATCADIKKLMQHPTTGIPGLVLSGKECLIMGKDGHDGAVSYLDDSGSLSERAATSTKLYCDSRNLYTIKDDTPVYCWRVHKVPESYRFLSEADAVIPEPPHGYAVPSDRTKVVPNAHYICVFSHWVSTVQERPNFLGVAVLKCGTVPVPVLVPTCTVSAAGVVTVSVHPLGGPKAAEQLARAVNKIWAKWARPGKTKAVESHSLQKNLFTALPNAQQNIRVDDSEPADSRVNNFTPSYLLHTLNRRRFSYVGHDAVRAKAEQLFPRGSRSSSHLKDPKPVVATVHCVWDNFTSTDNHTPGKAATHESTAKGTPTKVFDTFFDRAALFDIKRLGPCSDAELQTFAEYRAQRVTVKKFRENALRKPLALLKGLVQVNSTPEYDYAKQHVMPLPKRNPCIRVFSELKSAAGSTNHQDGETDAVLKLTVYTWLKESGKNGTLISPWNEWHITPVNNRRVAFDAETERHDLKHSVVSSFFALVLHANDRYERTLSELEKERTDHTHLSLNNILDKIEASELPEAPQPAGLVNSIKLHSYQLQSLRWMLNREKETLRDTLWWHIGKCGQESVWYSPVLRRLSPSVPAGVRGGFLAEEMGLGKTIEILALVLANPAPASLVSGGVTDSGVVLSRGTLVICKVSLVGQWVTEAKSKLANQDIRICEYHGSARVRDIQELSRFDIVVTTYETLCADMVGRSKYKTEPNPLPKVKWWRLVLDESHTTKDTFTKQSKAVIAVQADRRWACSGTPINTGVKDLVGQLASLHMDPLSQKGFYCAFLRSGMSSTRSTMIWLLKNIMIRHSKKQIMNGKPLLELPGKAEELVPVKFSKAERDVYTATYVKVVAAFKTYESLGAAYCNTHQLAIMSLISPLRRLASGGSFYPDQLAVRAQDTGDGTAVRAADAAPKGHSTGPHFPPPDESECSICMEDFDKPVSTPCGHWFCHECINAVLTQRSTCPLCRGNVSSVGTLRPAVYPSEAKPSTAPGAASTSSRVDKPTIYMMGSKVKALIDELTAMRAKDKSAKALIFTQFNDTLKFVTTKLAAAGFSHRTISGSMGMKQRAKAIEAFQNDPPTTVFVLSLRSGAVGINLTSANYVFILEPVMNAALDEQAVGRAWRMGQKREVIVKRLYVKGTVEESIMDMVKTRGNHSEGMFQPYGYRCHNNVAVHAGGVLSDKASLKYEELRKLFAAPAE